MALLREEAVRLEVSVAELIRRGVDATVRRGARASREELRRRARAAAGAFASDRTDVATNHDEHLAEAYTK